MPVRVETVCTDKIAVCPGCGNAMRFARAWSPIGELSALQTFECRPCGLSLTAEAVLQGICRAARVENRTAVAETAATPPAVATMDVTSGQ